MSGERWIIIPGWDKFQHRDGFRQRVPTWIKDYTEQTNKDAYLELTFHQRGLLSDLRREYAATRRQLLGTTSALSRRLGQRVTENSLQALYRAGFIEFVASEPASDLASEPAVTEEKRTTTYYNGSELRGDEQPDEQPRDPDREALAAHARATLKQLAGAVPVDDDDDLPF